MDFNFLEMFLYTFLKFFVSGLWQIFNMRNRFYIPLWYFILTYFWSSVHQINLLFFNLKDFLLKIIIDKNLRAFMYPVFLAGNSISVTAHIDEMILYLPNGITFTFLMISSFSCNIYICYELNEFFIFLCCFLLMSL